MEAGPTGEFVLAEELKTKKNGDKTGRKRATSYDVAKRAGVSQSAVSRVFQEGASASQAMRDRVHKAAEELGYRPNAIARGLITQRSNLVAVIISKLTNLYYPEVLVQLTQRFSERGIRVLLFALEREGDIGSILEQMLQYQVDGILTAAMMDARQLRTVESLGIPVVFYNRTIADEIVSSVRCDQEEGERWLVGELVKAGHRSFGIVAGPPDSKISSERTQAARERLREADIDDITQASGDYGYATGRTCFSEIVGKRGAPPDAIMGADDVMAIGCIDEAREVFQLKVPEDISIVGFDGVGPASYAAYDVSTVRQPVRRMTEAAVSMLLERIEDPELSREKRAFSGLRVRGGSARFSDDA